MYDACLVKCLLLSRWMCNLMSNSNLTIQYHFECLILLLFGRIYTTVLAERAGKVFYIMFILVLIQRGGACRYRFYKIWESVLWTKPTPGLYWWLTVTESLTECLIVSLTLIEIVFRKSNWTHAACLVKCLFLSSWMCNLMSNSSLSILFPLILNV